MTEPPTVPEPTPRKPIALDALDRRIVQLLREDGRRSYADIARLAGVSEPTIRKRVDRLVQSEAISILARVNPVAVGFAIDAMVGIRVKRGTVQSVGVRLAAMENVAYVAYMTGGFDLFVEVFVPDNEGLFRFLNQDLAAIEEITDAQAWHVLRTEKFTFAWEGETFIGEPDPRSEADERGPADRDDDEERGT